MSKAKETLVIADLHLDSNDPKLITDFIAFLEQRAKEAQALYILGDLFEAWIGDDDSQAAYIPVKNALATLSQAGTALYLQHGNRDFLLGSEFCQAVGASLLPEAQVVDLYGTNCLLMHGDSLCTDDLTYQQLRAQLHNPAWQQQFLAQSIEQRYQAAAALRQQSQAATQSKTTDIMDVNQNTVIAQMQAHGVQQLIHGHTHRPACHQFSLNDQTVKRWVLGDWQTQYNYLSCRPQGWQWIVF